MAKLLIKKKDGNLQISALSGERFNIGRQEENDLVLSDKTVSRVHASIIFQPTLKIWLINNLSQTNPVFVNNAELLKKAVLFDQDIIEIGIYNLKFVEE